MSITTIFKKIITIIVILVLVGIAVCFSWLCIRNRLRDAVPSSCIINGESVGGMEIGQIQNRFKKIASNRAIFFDKTKITAGEIAEISISTSLDQFSIRDYLLGCSKMCNIVYRVDKSRLQSIVDSQPEKKVKDAYFELKDGEVVEHKEQYGNRITITDDVVKEVELAFKNGTELNLKKYFVEPGISLNDLQKAIKKTKKTLNRKVSVNLGLTKIQLSRDQIVSCYSVKKSKLRTEQVGIDSIIKWLASKYNTVGKTRVFKTHSKKKIKVPGGTLGWQLNQAETMKTLQRVMENGEKKCSVTWQTKGLTMSETGDDIGKTYVEVSIKEQMLWYYKNGKVKLSSPVVTGLPTTQRHTKTGAHQVLYKQRDRTLRGAARAWSSFVKYWMPFTYDGQGLHDASWRGNFGGSIYLSNGSHGCVNLPTSFAEKLFAVVEQGTPVIVY